MRKQLILLLIILALLLSFTGGCGCGCGCEEECDCVCQGEEHDQCYYECESGGCSSDSSSGDKCNPRY